jgi:hypothetical protein
LEIHLKNHHSIQQLECLHHLIYLLIILWEYPLFYFLSCFS